MKYMMVHLLPGWRPLRLPGPSAQAPVEAARDPGAAPFLAACNCSSRISTIAAWASTQLARVRDPELADRELGKGFVSFMMCCWAFLGVQCMCMRF